MAVETTTAAQSAVRPPPSCGDDGHAGPLEAGADLGVLATVEGAVAAGGAAAAAGVEDGERAHAAAGEPDEVEPLRR